MNQASNLEVATLGGGCFWCTEAVFQRVRGVRHVQSGYAGGHVKNPTYEQICGGNTGHAEVVRIEFDPQVIGYAQILEIFLATHDATTLNRQGNDVGTQYRSVIFTHSPQQAEVAAQVVAQAQKLSSRPIVTQIAPLPDYFPAEDYHQDYFNQHPGQGYCAFVVAPKVEKFQKTFRQYLLA